MSSWLSLSLPNPFKPNECPNPSDQAPSPTAGVKDDLSALRHSIGRHLHGVAAFLAPPPEVAAAAAESSSLAIEGIKNDLVEIGGSVKSSLSVLSSRLATKLLRFQNDGGEEEGEGDEEEGEEEEDEDGGVVGVTDEVVDFVEEISLRPECWTDFPLSLDDDINLSTGQKEHASTIERLVPSLADLRHTSCNHLSEEKFWMIYFIFLLPRLHEQDAKLLSTPEIVEAREILLQKLRNRRNALVEESEPETLSQEGNKDKRNQGEDSPSRQKEVLEGTSSSEQRAEIDRETTTSVDTKKQPENEEISFSDLEDDENDENDLAGRLSRLRQARDERVPSPNGSSEWVRLGENSGTQGAGGGAGQKEGQSISRGKDSEGEESNDWLTVDEGDLESLSNV